VPKQYGKIEYQPILDDVLKESPNLKHIIQVRTEGVSKYHTLEKLIEDGQPTKENLQALAARRPDPDEVSQIMPTAGRRGCPRQVRARTTAISRTSSTTHAAGKSRAKTP